MTVRQEELFLEMFEQSWRALNEDFYDANFHGANWKQNWPSWKTPPVPSSVPMVWPPLAW